MNTHEEVLVDVVHDLRDASDSGEWLDALNANRRAHTALMDVRTSAVSRARADGATWQQIGDALGVSRQAVQERYGRPTEPLEKEPRQPAPPKTYLQFGLDGQPVGVILPAGPSEISRAIREHLRATDDDPTLARQEPLTSSSDPDTP